MVIIGALDSGLRQDHSVLLTKSIIDGFTSMVLASTLGLGVLFSVVPVFLYQGGIAILTAIGVNMLEIKQIRVANLLPSILNVSVIILFQ